MTRQFTAEEIAIVRERLTPEKVDHLVRDLPAFAKEFLDLSNALVKHTHAIDHAPTHDAQVAACMHMLADLEAGVDRLMVRVTALDPTGGIEAGAST